MSRGAWWFLGVLVGVVGAAAPRPGVIRARAVELVDERGEVVGRLAVTPSGAELVLGGSAQASLVTEDGLAALNLVGDASTARLVAGDEAALLLPTCE